MGGTPLRVFSSASLVHAGPRTLLPLLAMASQLAWRLSFSSSGFPPFSWPAVLYPSLPVFRRRKYSDGNAQLRRMVLIKKVLSPTCAPAHRDIATSFFGKIFRSDGEMCVSVTSSPKTKSVTKKAPKMAPWIETHIPPSDRNIFSKKVCGDVSMSRRTYS